MEQKIDEILHVALKLQECKIFLNSPKEQFRLYGEETAKEYMIKLKDSLVGYLTERFRE